MALQSMGIKDVKADFDCYGTEDQGKGELTIDRCALVSPGLGEIELAARVVNADAIFWNALDESDLLALQDSTAALGSARLVLADKSLLERSLRAFAHHDRPAGRDAARQLGARGAPLSAVGRADLPVDDPAPRHAWHASSSRAARSSSRPSPTRRSASIGWSTC